MPVDRSVQKDRVKYTYEPGSSHPPGATTDQNGTNFCCFSRSATDVELLLFETADSMEPFQVIPLDPAVHRTFFFWHVYVHGLREGALYAWRVNGPDCTRRSGHRFDEEKVLLDPWTRAVDHRLWDRERACAPGENLGRSMRSVVVTSHDYDWENDEGPSISLEDSIIYELHVAGFTKSPSSGVNHPGTFCGLAQKASYLKELGITHVELMPVMAFDEQDLTDGASRRGLKNHWGYSTHSFFSPQPRYCASSDPSRQPHEFRDLVKALHAEGIGLILDVAFNHTAEGGEDGPAINFKGFCNEVFYHLDASDRRIYKDYTGCKNTVNCNHPLVSRFLIQCLEYWVEEMHVDGFRFDLASVLARGEDGNPLYHAPVLWNIEFSRILRPAKIIAEAWDAAGLYQVGDFPGFRWLEWNGRFRDDVRRFVRGDKGLVGQIATRMSGSSDLYAPQGRLPTNSVNFITCHDGFTLCELVSYNKKYNEANGEENRDGAIENFSSNCGVEGESNDPDVLSLRERQARNFLAILFLSQGVPMVLAGDEVLRTQRGNNNCYCQDNEQSWFDWTLVEKHREFLEFFKEMVAFRKRHPSLRRVRFLTGTKKNPRGIPDVTWHGVKLNEPLWNDPSAQVLSYTLGVFSCSQKARRIFKSC